MSIDTAFRRLQEANPVPHPDSLREDVPELAVLLATTAQRSTEMQTHQDSDVRVETRSRTRKWGVALAAVAAALSIGILAVVIPGDETQPASGMDPADLVDTWIDRYETGDVAGFHALMHENATWSCEGAAQCEAPTESYFEGPFGVDDWDARQSRRTYAAHGSLNADCSTEGAAVTCDFSKMDVFRPAPTTYRYVFHVENGLITNIEMIADQGIAAPEGELQIQEYERWMEENHPDMHEELFYLGTMLLETNEQLEQHHQLIDDWASSQSA